MAELLLLAVAASLVNHCAILGQFGPRFTVAEQDRVSASAALGLAVLCALPAAAVGVLLYSSLTSRSHEASLLAPLAFVLLAATIAPAALVIGSRLWPGLRVAASRSAPLAVATTLFLGLGHLHLARDASATQAVLRAATAAAAFAIVQLLFALLAERIESADTPAPLRGAPILLLAAGLVLLALAGVGGIAAR